MRVLIFVYSLRSGGAERVCANLANAWAERGNEVTLLTLAAEGDDFYPLARSVKRVGLGLTSESGSLLTALWFNWQRLVAVRRVIHSEKPDIVLSMMTSANVLSILASTWIPVKVFVSERTHPPMFPLGAMWNFLRRWTYRSAAGVVALSDESRRWLTEHCPGAQVVVIPNYVSWPLAPCEPTVVPEVWFDNSEHVLLAVGRLGEEKGFDLLLNAFARISPNHPSWRLAIVGEGLERQNLEILAERLGLGNRVRLTGRVGNIADWYSRADLFVLSSRFEGFPNALVEAMASGTACVSFDCDTGPRDIIRHGVDGILVSPTEGVGGLAAALSQLMADEHLRRKLGEHAREVKERFSLEHILNMWDRVLLAGKSAS